MHAGLRVILQVLHRLINPGLGGKNEMVHPEMKDWLTHAYIHMHEEKRGLAIEQELGNIKWSMAQNISSQVSVYCMWKLT